MISHSAGNHTSAVSAKYSYGMFEAGNAGCKMFTDAKSWRLIGIRSVGSQEAPMNDHKIGRTTVLYRQTIVARVTNERLRPTDFARNFGISVRTVHKWLMCHREGGVASFDNGSSAANTLRHKLPTEYEELFMYLRCSFRMRDCHPPVMLDFSDRPTAMAHRIASSSGRKERIDASRVLSIAMKPTLPSGALKHTSDPCLIAGRRRSMLDRCLPVAPDLVDKFPDCVLSDIKYTLKSGQLK